MRHILICHKQQASFSPTWKGFQSFLSLWEHCGDFCSRVLISSCFYSLSKHPDQPKFTHSPGTGIRNQTMGQENRIVSRLSFLCELFLFPLWKHPPPLLFIQHSMYVLFLFQQVYYLHICLSFLEICQFVFSCICLFFFICDVQVYTHLPVAMHVYVWIWRLEVTLGCHSSSENGC